MVDSESDVKFIKMMTLIQNKITKTSRINTLKLNIVIYVLKRLKGVYICRLHVSPRELPTYTVGM